MLYNSLAIITLGYLEDMSYDYILSKLQTFKGTKRRYTVKTQGNNVFGANNIPTRAPIPKVVKNLPNFILSHLSIFS